MATSAQAQGEHCTEQQEALAAGRYGTPAVCSARRRCTRAPSGPVPGPSQAHPRRRRHAAARAPDRPQLPHTFTQLSVPHTVPAASQPCSTPLRRRLRAQPRFSQFCLAQFLSNQAACPTVPPCGLVRKGAAARPARELPLTRALASPTWQTARQGAATIKADTGYRAATTAQRPHRRRATAAATGRPPPRRRTRRRCRRRAVAVAPWQAQAPCARPLPGASSSSSAAPGAAAAARRCRAPMLSKAWGARGASGPPRPRLCEPAARLLLQAGARRHAHGALASMQGARPRPGGQPQQSERGAPRHAAAGAPRRCGGAPGARPGCRRRPGGGPSSAAGGTSAGGSPRSRASAPPRSSAAPRRSPLRAPSGPRRTRPACLVFAREPLHIHSAAQAVSRVTSAVLTSLRQAQPAGGLVWGQSTTSVTS